jgi:hypothetical protein
LTGLGYARQAAGQVPSLVLLRICGWSLIAVRINPAEPSRRHLLVVVKLGFEPRYWQGRDLQITGGLRTRSPRRHTPEETLDFGWPMAQNPADSFSKEN